MSEEQARQQARNAPSAANAPEQRHRIAPQVPNMLPMNISGSFGGSTAPRSIHRPNHPTFTGSGYFSSNPYPNLSSDPTDRLPFGITSSHMNAAVGGGSNHMGSLTNTPRSGLQYSSPYRASNAPPQTPLRIPQPSVAPGFPPSNPFVSSNSSKESENNQNNRPEKENADEPAYVPYTPVPGASRVPSNNVGRKAPLMKDSPMEGLSPNGSRKLAMVEQTRSTREPTAPEAPAQPDATTPTSNPNVCRHRSLKRSPPTENSSRGKIARRSSTSKDHIDDNDLDADGSTDEEYMPTASSKQVAPASHTAIISSVQANPESSTTMESTNQPTTISSTPAKPAPRPSPPRPRFTYELPAKLEGTKTALGPNWDEYIRLMEDLILEEITAHQFDVQARNIFMASDPIRKYINNVIAKMMILPKLEEERLRLDKDKVQE
ncbi:hypothetical protein HRS9122_03107 [Pyrenophora teres f. teres]|nr:hypothetical protein HRS9122_03107 [Pyrenophora teres f. teres]